MKTISDFPRIWCPNCNDTVRLEFDFLPADEVHPKDSADLVCNRCKHIIATLHEGDEPTSIADWILTLHNAE